MIFYSYFLENNYIIFYPFFLYLLILVILNHVFNISIILFIYVLAKILIKLIFYELFKLFLVHFSLLSHFPSCKSFLLFRFSYFFYFYYFWRCLFNDKNNLLYKLKKCKPHLFMLNILLNNELFFSNKY